MKKILCSVLLFGCAVATQAMAALESVKMTMADAPQFPPTLIAQGVTEGHVVFAVSVSETGRVRDAVPLAYTHEPLVRACRDAMAEWQLTPARLDGQPVPVQMDLRIDFKREGVVETNSINIVNHMLDSRFPGLATRRLAYRLATAAELDHQPTRVAAAAPEYDQHAEADGVRGSVQVFFYIDERGEVRMPSVTAEAHPYLSDIAVSAVRQWRFEPPTHHGKPVMIAASQEFKFVAKR